MTIIPDDDNPFAAPQSDIGSRVSEWDGDKDPEAFRVRRTYLPHESSIKSVGLFGYVTAIFGLFFMAAGILGGLGLIQGNIAQPNSSPEMVRITMWIGALVWAIVAFSGIALGFGLRRLQVWSRWTGMVLIVFSLLYTLLTGLVVAFLLGGNSLPILIILLVLVLIQGYIFYLLVIPRSGMIFSTEYHLIVRKTAEIQSQSGLLIKILLGLTIAIVGIFSVLIVVGLLL